MHLLRAELVALHFTGAHPPGPLQVCHTELPAGSRPFRRLKIETVPVRGLQHHGAILLLASVHGNEVSAIILSGQPQGIVRPQPPFGVYQVGGVAKAQRLPEQRGSVLIEVEVRPPFLRGHGADLRAAKGGIVGLVPHGGPIGGVMRCRCGRCAVVFSAAAGGGSGGIRLAAAGAQAECQQQRQHQRQTSLSHRVMPTGPARRGCGCRSRGWNTPTKTIPR